MGSTSPRFERAKVSFTSSHNKALSLIKKKNSENYRGFSLKGGITIKLNILSNTMFSARFFFVSVFIGNISRNIFTL